MGTLRRKTDLKRNNNTINCFPSLTTKIMLNRIFILLCCPFLSLALLQERQEKSFSLFSVLKWKNTGCQSVSDVNLQGVCYTKQECDDLGGEEDGNCAAGFGTCCIIRVRGTTDNRGGTVTQNCSYIENVDFPANAAGGTKSWRIKVSQIECDSTTRAPNGCLQYFLENTNTIQTFNWDGATTRAGADGGLLAAQDYRACIRQNAGMCTIQWTESVVTGTADAFDFNSAMAMDANA